MNEKYSSDQPVKNSDLYCGEEPDQKMQKYLCDKIEEICSNMSQDHRNFYQ